ncbi:MAG: hypothetical protein ACE5FI_11735 [Anaerolineales bacterium]
MRTITTSRLRWGLIGLLLASFWLRLHALLALPAFIDEANHLRWAAEIWDGRVVFPFSTAKGLTIYYFSALLPWGAGALWLGRAATVLSGVVTLSGLWALGRAWGRAGMGLLAGAIYALLPWTFFHERIATADPLVASLAVVLAWAASLWAHRAAPGRWKHALALAGVLLALPLLKLSAVSFWVLPPVVMLLSGNRRGALPRRWTLLLGAYVFAGIALSAVLGATALRYDVSGELVSRSGDGSAAWPQLVFHNVADLASWGWTYLGVAGAAVVISAILALVWRSAAAWTALLGFIAAAGIFVVTADGAFPRYYMAALAFGTVLLAHAAVEIWRRGTHRALGGAGALGLMLLTTIPFGRFAWQAYADPAQLDLPFEDQRQHVLSWSAGYGIDAATRFVVETIQTHDRPAVVYGQDLATWRIMQLYWPEDANGQPYELWDAAAPSVIDVVANGEPAYLLVDRARDKANFEGLTINPQELARFPRPHGAAPVVVYRLIPEPFQFPAP